MANITDLAQVENGAASRLTINSNFEALNTAQQPQASLETVDGSTSVFTFLTLSTQPRLIFADNAPMRAVSSRGTVNWTWNQTTKQVTLTIPPQDDIFALI